MNRLALVLLCFAAARGKPVPIVIDTDIGTAIDDIWAISYAIARSDLFSIRMVLTGSFNTTGRAQVAAQFLERLGRSDIPVGIGLHTPPNPGLQGGVGPEWPWAATYNLATYPGVVEKDGVGALRRELEAATPESPLWILGIGPYTNIAAVIGKRPDLARNARFLTMGGSVAIGYDGSPPAVAEYNVVTDIPAAQTVFSAPWQMPIVVAPLDTTLFFQIAGETYKEFVKAAESSTHPLPKLLLENYRVWYDNGGKDWDEYNPFSPETASPTLFDLQAAYMAGKLTISPSGWSPQPVFSWLAIDGLHLAIQSDGIMKETPSAPAMAVAADWAPPSRNESVQSVAGFTSGWIVFRARSD